MFRVKMCVDLRYGDCAASMALWQVISSPDLILIHIESGTMKLIQKGSAPFFTL